ncbi:swr complex subunit [Yamadazyma tenuis]|uniref:SWR1-complex protein 4 n=1 Tax=Candida tenuis (strain ATCC 10573 / BCRC 21748 / CBS 615 / JCM 9827 / NBRC 10315 / NRRL Y-1498 / VKM Y-70) TaxID=590646 RepID=G3B5M8_CANTC|nr:uncharacterized protein CANTEDRAFT_130760 [Yamadazyma tenuis ATCC 10573]EGV63267.1 hypothetical protein CANTEDRAFT_130760 [Yamadazyma tenuis ATCC 10573]WEJ96917.1 swr complex subunit [Yamadazyma tenuis]
MSANDILDVLNIQRDNSGQPSKKKAKHGNDSTNLQARQTGMARELYNLLGPNTPPVNLTNANNNVGVKDRWKSKATPWTLKDFKPKSGDPLTLYHWVRGSKELLEQDNIQVQQPYFFTKFSTNVDIPDFVDEETFNKYMEDIEVEERKNSELWEERRMEKERQRQEKLAKEKAARDNEKKIKGEKGEVTGISESKKDASSEVTSQEDGSQSEISKESTQAQSEEASVIPESKTNAIPWTYKETKHLFELCNSFELKWHIILDRYEYSSHRSLEDLKEQFYRVCKRIYSDDANGNPALIDSLGSFSKSKEVERKQYLERLLKRTPAEIAEEESLVIEARRFELAAKKMLVERSNLLTLLDSPQTSQSVQQYQSSQGLTNLYNNLMIMDKNQKRRQLQNQSSPSHDPIPPPIPLAASSSIRKERTFQTHLQQHLSNLVKQNQSQGNKNEISAIHKLLMKRLTAKEEEAYGLHYHANERLTPGVILRSSQRLPGLQQRQSVLKSVTSVFTELDIPTAGGTSWRPVMPTRKAMAKYDELLRAVVALLEVKKGRDKLEAEIQLIRSQKGLE